MTHPHWLLRIIMHLTSLAHVSSSLNNPSTACHTLLLLKNDDITVNLSVVRSARVLLKKCDVLLLMWEIIMTKMSIEFNLYDDAHPRIYREH